MICSPRGVLWCASNRATATAMQYPVGWPRVLDSRGATSGPPVKLLRHRAKDLLFELRERSLAVWHSRVRTARLSRVPTNTDSHTLAAYTTG